MFYADFKDHFPVKGDTLLCSAFGLWIGGDTFYDHFCQPVSMNELWRFLVINQHQMYHLVMVTIGIQWVQYNSTLRKYGLTALFGAMKKFKIRASEVYGPECLISLYSV